MADQVAPEGATAADQWRRVRDRLARKHGRETIAAWLDRAELVDVSPDCVLLRTSNPFIRAKITERFADDLAAAWSRRIEIEVGPLAPAGAPRAAAPAPPLVDAWWNRD